MNPKLLTLIRTVAQKRILFLKHVLDEMNAPDELITPDEVRATVMNGEIIEDYVEDARGHSCLMLGFGTDNRPVHVVCSPKNDYLTITTVYLPSSKRWEPNWKARKTR